MCLDPVRVSYLQVKTAAIRKNWPEKQFPVEESVLLSDGLRNFYPGVVPAYPVHVGRARELHIDALRLVQVIPLLGLGKSFTTGLGITLAFLMRTNQSF